MGRLTETEYFAFAMPKGSALKARLDSHLRKMKESGELYRILADDFNPEIAKLVAETIGAKLP